MVLDWLKVVAAAEGRDGFNNMGVVVMDDCDPTEGTVEEVVIVEVNVVLVVDGALREAGCDSDDTPPSLRMFLS